MQSPLSSSISDARRILVRGVNWLGDAVMSTPALLRLRERFPEAHIALLTPEKLRDLWLHHPAVNEVVPFRAGEGVFSVSRKLRDKGFDLALVLPNSPRSALEVCLARIPRRIGFAGPWRNGLLTTRVAGRPGARQMRKRSKSEILGRIAANVAREHFPAQSHHIHHYLHLVGAVGASTDPTAPVINVTATDLAAFAKRFELANHMREVALLGLNAGAEYGPAKRWPAEHFVTSAERLQRLTNCRWLVLGGGRDIELAGHISAEITRHAPRAMPPLNLAGRTSLRELCAVLKLCRVLLTNDSGPMHLAAAVGTAVVVPFGSTSPELTGPGLAGDPRHLLLTARVPCAPCFRRACPIDFRCMRNIEPEQVVAAVLASLTDPPATPA
jgi:heptosyltransferase II